MGFYFSVRLASIFLTMTSRNDADENFVLNHLPLRFSSGKPYDPRMSIGIKLSPELKCVVGMASLVMNALVSNAV